MSSSSTLSFSTATPTRSPFATANHLSPPKLLSFPPKPLLLFALRLPATNLAPFGRRPKVSDAFDDGFEPANDNDAEGDEFGSSFEDEDEEESGGSEVEDGKGPRVSGRDSELGRLYVGNLPYSMNSSQLAQVFEEAGRVINVEVGLVCFECFDYSCDLLIEARFRNEWCRR